MRVINVQRLDGIPREHLQTIFVAMRGCTNGQRMAVVLYLMSDLPDGRHTLRDIEANLRKVFPQSVRSRLLPDEYVDFAASAIRFLFNAETALVKSGRLDEDFRLWRNPERGIWRNTPVGNQYALQVLRDRELLLQKGDLVQNPVQVALPVVNRPYLEEELAEPLRAEPQATTHDDADENLLAYVDRVLESLPNLSVGRDRSASGAVIDVSGGPAEVRALLQRLIDVHVPATVTLSLTIGRDGLMSVAVRSAPADAA